MIARRFCYDAARMRQAKDLSALGRTPLSRAWACGYPRAMNRSLAAVLAAAIALPVPAAAARPGEPESSGVSAGMVTLLSAATFGLRGLSRRSAPRANAPETENGARRELESAIARAKDAGVSGSAGLILSGKNGGGRHALARRAAADAGAELRFANAGLWADEPWIAGINSARVRESFREARASGRLTVLFIDAIESLRHSTQRGGDPIEALLAELRDPKNARIAVIGSTGRPERVAPSLTQAGLLPLSSL